ncbi:MAG: glycoside hydrolase family 38 C-terminal domain-containing protein [bacterium]
MADFDPLRDIASVYADKLFEAALWFQNVAPQRWNFTAIAQSHLDAAWRWRVFQSKSKAKATFKNALYKIANHDDFKFSASSPQYYEWIKDRHPAIFRAIQDAVRGGHWELVGGMWVEPDGNMPDGESLVRQRLYGQRFYLNHFGRIAEVEWLPDTFGFAWTIPQILAKSGAKYFWTGKPLWNDTTKFPFSTFLWQSPDGSQILTHVSPIGPERVFKMKDFIKTNRLVNFREKLVASYETRPSDIVAKLSNDALPEVGIFYGWGDGGHGPRDFEVAAVNRLKDKSLIKIGMARDFFQRLERYRDRLPVWNDEIYLEFHRGVFTTQAWIKNANRRAEIAARSAEVAHSINSLFGDPYPGEVIRENWKKLLFNQFHDILPGSSIPEVYEDAKNDFEEFFSTMYHLIRTGIEAIALRINTAAPDLGNAMPVIVYNALSWTRTATAFLRVYDDDVEVVDINGRKTLSQVIELNKRKTLALTAEDVPDLGYRTYYLRKKRDEQGPAAQQLEPMARQLEDGSVQLENEHIKAVIDAESGWVTSLYYKNEEKEMLEGPSNRLRLYNDDNLTYPAWNIDPNYKRREIEIGKPDGPPEIVENGEVAAAVVIKRKVNNSTVSQKVRIFRRRPLLMFTTRVDWRENKALLKVEFETAVKTDRVASDIPYGAIERPTHPQLPAQKAHWEIPCQKWIDLNDGRSGLALLNQDKYGFSVKDGKIALSLLRGPRYPVPIPNAWGLPPLSERPFFTDQGEHTIRYALLPHSGDWRDAKVWQMAAELGDTLMVVRTDQHEGVMPREATVLSCHSRSTYVGAIKRPEDNPDKPDTLYHQIVVRLIEAAGRPDTVTLKFGPGFTITDAKETDLLEFSQKPLPDQKVGEVAIDMTPFEIKTIKITLKDAPAEGK